MSHSIEHIEGIGPAYADKLALAGIKTTQALLGACGSASGRKITAGQTGLTESQLLKWTNMADLMRIKGVGSEYAELLEAAGVDTVKELRQRNAENLAAAMLEANAKKALTRIVPSASVVSSWVDQAKEMEPMITH